MLELKIIIKSDDNKSLIIKRSIDSEDVQLVVSNINSELSTTVKAAELLQALKSIYPDLIIKLPTNE